ncbi:hypothetical protein DFP72DRAFT_515102 [Ephemerocybe angulata]|uniref:DUF6534 domain-containing protein n=1 Tax=Ephemerocybe angulata TaxID=980116 RepID=A0A8H6HPR3_9AGAR|nr:hypothetical protein DFP72DRAFT_515102 [Tulosesus angulatus]
MTTADMLGPAFAGYTIGAVLFGVTLLQAYHYFMTNHGSNWQKITVGIILILDTIHFSFAIHMFFVYLLTTSGSPSLESWVVWSLKAMGSTQVIFIIYVQGLYLYKIWMYSRSSPVLLSTRFSRTLKAWVVFLSILALGIGVLFLVELQKIQVITSFDIEFEYVIYVGFGTVCLVDLGIALAMCLMLYKSSGGITKKSNMIITQLIQYIVGTGLLTSLSALMCMVLYIAEPTSLLYLGVEYSNTRLYAISVLALYNSQSRLRDKLSEPADLKGSSHLYFADPDKFAHTNQEPELGSSQCESGAGSSNGYPRPARKRAGAAGSRGHRKGTSSTTAVAVGLAERDGCGAETCVS